MNGRAEKRGMRQSSLAQFFALFLGFDWKVTIGASIPDRYTGRIVSRHS